MDSEGKVDPLIACEAEIELLKKSNAALLNLAIRIRADHDQMFRPESRPCRCNFCRQADEAIAAAKGGA